MIKKKQKLNSGQTRNGREGEKVHRASGEKASQRAANLSRWKKFENQMTKEWIENWIFISSANKREKRAKKNWMRWTKTFPHLSWPSQSPFNDLLFNLRFLFVSLFRCLICIRCSPSKSKLIAKERRGTVRHSARRTWCSTASQSLTTWRNRTSIKWTRIREMPITYVSVVFFIVK